MSKLYDRAAEAVKKRNYDYAIELFIQELTLEPNNVEARRALRAAEIKKYHELGVEPGGFRAYLSGLGPLLSSFIYRITKNWEKLMLACEQFLKNAPKSRLFLGMLGDAARKAGHEDAALVAFEELRDADHGNQHAIRSLAQIYKEKGDLGRSLHCYELLRKQLPNDPEAAKAIRDLAASGATRKVEERAAAGEGSFRDQLKDKDVAEKLEAHSHRIRSDSDIDAAIARQKEEIAKSPNDARLLKTLGDLYVKKKHYGAALEALEQAQKKKPGDAPIAEALGDLKIRRYDDEIQQLTVDARVNPGDADLRARLKQVKDERTEFCIDEFRRRVQEHPTELGLRFQLGQHLYKADRHDEAIAELQKAVSDPRRKAYAQNLLGKCFSAKGMHDLAIKELEKARQGLTSMDEVNKEVTYNLGLVYEKIGKKDRAAQEFERIIEVDINYKDVMKRIEALK